MTKSDSIKNLAAALSKFHKAMKPVKKGAENPFFKSKYADLSSLIEATREPLTDNGLSVAQFPTEGGLISILMHESGEWIEETAKVQPKDATPQALGSAITYMRRYAYGAILGIATEEDDDGNAASGQAGNQAPRRAPVKPLQRPKIAVDRIPKDDVDQTIVEKSAQIKDMVKAISPATDTSDRILINEKIKELTGLPALAGNMDEILSRLSIIIEERKAKK